MDTVVQTLVNALMQSSFVALMAVGLVLIFGVMRVINFAHGEFYMAGAYVVFWLYAQHELPFFAAVVAAMVIVGVIGLIMEQLLFKAHAGQPARRAHHVRGRALHPPGAGRGYLRRRPDEAHPAGLFGGDARLRHGWRPGAVAAARRLRYRGACC